MKFYVPIQRSGREGFSLIEMMIAIVILGLGLTMVATMFPVAWDRARQLSEHTTEQTVTAGVAATVESTLRPGGMREAEAWDVTARICSTNAEAARIGTAGLAGDLIFDPNIYHTPGLLPGDLPKAILNDWPKTRIASDTRVHALHLENLLAEPTGKPPETVEERPWLLEQVGTKWLNNPTYPGGGFPRQLACGFLESSFLTPRFPVNMRVHPPLEALAEATQPRGPVLRDLWLRRAERRRFAWGVLHRLREYVGPTPDDFGTLSAADLAAKAASGWGSPRALDMYYVTLRRPNETNRYALQDPSTAPSPHLLSVTPARIESQPSEMDVLLPVAWRVQVELPGTLVTRENANGIPTEIRVPPEGAPEEMVDMMIGMFPKATRFVDEITGRVYQVVSTELNEGATQAILRLDQEITLEDIDLPMIAAGGGPPECPGCKPVTPTDPVADPEELLRTVWVYPPPVDRAQGSSGTGVVFKGRTPVSNIEVRTVTLTPGQS